MGASHGKFVLHFVNFTREHQIYERYQLGILKKNIFSNLYLETQHEGGGGFLDTRFGMVLPSRECRG